MLRLYDYAGSANCYKIKLLLAQLGLAYETVSVEIFRGESRTPDFAKKNPAGRVPVLEVADGEYLAESNAILAFLASGTAGRGETSKTEWWPDEPLSRARILQWLFFEQYELEPTVGTARFWKLTGRHTQLAEAFATKCAQGRRALAALDEHLRTRTFVVAERYTIADIALYAYTHVAAEAGFDLPESVRRWIKRVEEQPRWFAGPAPFGALAHV